MAGVVTPLTPAPVPPKGPTLLRVRDVEKELAVCTSMVFKLINSGQLKSVRLGRSVRVPAAELKRFMDEIGA